LASPISRTTIDPALGRNRPFFATANREEASASRKIVFAKDDLQRAHANRDIAVIVPELVASRWYHYLLHNQTAAVIKAYLLFSGFRRVVVINVPWYLSS
jgi:hypothetical protein